MTPAEATALAGPQDEILLWDASYRPVCPVCGGALIGLLDRVTRYGGGAGTPATEALPCCHPVAPLVAVEMQQAAVDAGAVDLNA